MTNYIDIKTISAGVSTTIVADMAALAALTGMSSGDQAYVTANNRFFLYNGSGWYLIATVQDNAPSSITGVNSSYELLQDGTATTVTAVSTDPEGFPLTWSYAVTTGALGSTATVSQADNVFTITPSTSTGGTFTLTFSATDGTNGAVSAAAAFSLSFGIDVTYQRAVTDPDNDTTFFDRVDSEISVGGNRLAVPRLDATAADQEIHLYSIDDGSFERSIPAESGRDAFAWAGYALQLSPNGTRLAAGSMYEPMSGTYTRTGVVDIYNAATGSLIRTHSNPITNVSNGYFGNGVACNNTYVAISSNNATSGSRKGIIYIYNLSDGSLERTIENPTTVVSGYADKHFGACMDMSGDYLIVSHQKETVSGNDYVGAVYIYDLSDGSLLRKTSWPSDFTYYSDSTPNFGHLVKFNSDGSKYAVTALRNLPAASADATTQKGLGRVYVFNTSTGSLENTFTNPNTGGQVYNSSTSETIFGFDLDFNNSQIFIGDHRYGDSSNRFLGRVYEYDLSDSSLTATIDKPTSLDSGSVDSFQELGRGVRVSANNELIITCTGAGTRRVIIYGAS